jgi:hypothetical protein
MAFRALTGGLSMLASTFVLALAGCGDGGGSSSFGSGPAAGSSSSGGGYFPNATQPMLAVVDDNQRLQAQGGQGVGVFTEYQSGGQWHVWWTCDTSVTGLSCPFDVTVTVTSGSITNATSQFSDPSDWLTQYQGPTPRIYAATNTSAGIDAITFDTKAGATITLNAKLNGQDDGSFLFFVQDGKVNGGYTHTVTDPLMLVPASP